MDGRATESALDRIDTALARIEAAAHGLLDDKANLRRKHELLKSAVTEALGEIDALIAGQGR